LRRKDSAKTGGYSGFSLDLKSNFKTESNAQVKPITTFKVAKPSFVRKQVGAL
jgi:hypothetical protein